MMAEEYLLSIIREQQKQIEALARAVLSISRSQERLLQRIQLLEAGEAILQMQEGCRNLN